MSRFAPAIGVWLLLGLLAARAGAEDSVRVRKLTLNGATKISSLDERRIVRDIQSRDYELAKLDEIAERIAAAFQREGYFAVFVGRPRIAYVGKRGSVHLVDAAIAVKEGERYRLKAIRFSRGSAFPQTTLRSQFPIADGEILDREKIALGMETLRRLYGSKGHLDFVLVPNIEIDQSSREISLAIDLEEGPVWHLGKLRVEGEESLLGARDRLLNGWSPHQGEVFDPGILRKFLRDLNARPEVSPEQVFRLSLDHRLHTVEVGITLVKPAL